MKTGVRIITMSNKEKVAIDFVGGEQIVFDIHPINRSIIVTHNRNDDEEMVVRPIVSNQFEIKLID